jgi:hypothetical protein
VYDDEVTAHILAMCDTGALIPMCAWCERIRVDDDWVQLPRVALAAIDVRNTVSHTICPSCAAQQQTRKSGPSSA